MQHYSPCFECLDGKNRESFVMAQGEVTHELFAVCKCPHGHITISDISHDLFEILYQSAIRAFRKDFCSESVLNFTVSLERAYEQYIKLEMLSVGVELNSIDAFWKEIAKRSECQYGAFCSAYIKTEKETWDSVQKQAKAKAKEIFGNTEVVREPVKFRNNVAHNGYIATSSEVRQYGEYVTYLLAQIVKSKRTRFLEESRKLRFHIKAKSIKVVQERHKNAKISSNARLLAINWRSDPVENITFSQALANIEKLDTELSSCKNYSESMKYYFE
jgi:hypothetical protein